MARRGIAWLAICALFLASGCGRTGHAAGAKEFTVRGIVRGLSPDRTTIDIQHEAIPGYMPEMTMPFALKDPTNARELKIDDAISFRLIVNDRDAAIDRISRIENDLVRVTAPTRKGTTSAAIPDVPRLKAGDKVPPFHLTNENGETITPETFRGRPFVLTFIFTRCPVPNFCPLMSRNFAQLQDAIRRGGDDSLGQTKLLSISFDPEHDTPAVLKDYAAAEKADPKIWSFATGTGEQIEALTSAFAVMVRPESGTFSHGLATALVDGNGRVVEIWRGNGWRVNEVLEKIRPQTDG